MRAKYQQMDQRIRNVMMVHTTLHPVDDIERLYMSRKGGRRGLVSIEQRVRCINSRTRRICKK